MKNLKENKQNMKSNTTSETCQYYFRGAQFSWIHDIKYIHGNVISWSKVDLCEQFMFYL